MVSLNRLTTPRSRSIIGVFLISLMLASTSMGATRIAIIHTGGGDTLANISSVAEAELSSESDFNLVERQQIDHVLAEQKLSLTGLIDPTSALQVGKILSTDLLVLIEGESNSPQFGLVIFDPGNGVQLWNAAATSSKGQAAAANIVSSVKAAATKRADVANRKTLCIFAVRNGDLSRQYDGLCDAVGKLTERGMVSSSTVAMLERTRLDQVTRERALAVDAATQQLLASLVIVDLEVDRGTTADSLKATALLSDATGKSLGKVTVSSPNQDAAALAGELVASLNQNLKTPATAPLDNRAEAARFNNESLFRMLNSDFAHAVAPAEAAHALAPDNLAYRAVLAHALISAGWVVYRMPPGGIHHGDGSWEDRSVAPPGVLRGAQLVVENQLRFVPSDVSEAKLARDQFLDAVAVLRQFLSQAVSAHRYDHAPLITSDIPTLQSDLRRILLTENNRVATPPHDQAAFDAYSDSIVQLLDENYGLFSSNSQRWAADVRQIVEAWLTAKSKAGAACLSREMGVLEIASMGWQYKDYGLGMHGSREPYFSIGDAERESLDALRKRIASDSDPVVQHYASLLEFSLSITQPEIAPEKLRAMTAPFIEKQLASLDSAPSAPARQASYRMMVAADGLLDRTSLDGLYSEQIAIAMFAHHDFFQVVINRATSQHLGEPEAAAAARRSRILQGGKQTLGLADVHLTDGDKLAYEESFINNALRVTGFGVNERVVPVAPPVMDANWYGSRKLIDLIEVTTATTCLYAPRVDGQFAYALGAVDPGDNQPFQIQLIKLPLAGGRPEMLASLPSQFRDRLNLRHTQMDAISQLVSSATLAEGYYAATVWGCGVMLFPISGDDAVQLDETTGFPVRQANGVAILDGVVYAALGSEKTETYIAGYDIKTKQVGVIASTVRKDRQSPFDDGSAFDVSSLLADAPRKRLIVTAVRRDESANKVTGIWEFKPATRAWRQLLPITLWMERNANRTGGAGTGIDFVRPAGPDALLMGLSAGLLTFDLRRDQVQTIHLDLSGVAPVPRDTPRMPGVGDAGVAAVADHYRIGGGWQELQRSNLRGTTLWTRHGRINLANGAAQDFDVTRPEARLGMTIIEPTPDGRAVLGDPWGLVLIDPRPGHGTVHEKLTPFADPTH